MLVAEEDICEEIFMKISKAKAGADCCDPVYSLLVAENERRQREQASLTATESDDKG